MVPEHLYAPTKPFISPSNSLNNKNTFNLKTSEIPNYITYVGKYLENNCSVVTKNDINKMINLAILRKN